MTSHSSRPPITESRPARYLRRNPRQRRINPVALASVAMAPGADALMLWCNAARVGTTSPRSGFPRDRRDDRSPTLRFHHTALFDDSRHPRQEQSLDREIGGDVAELAQGVDDPGKLCPRHLTARLEQLLAGEEIIGLLHIVDLQLAHLGHHAH